MKLLYVAKSPENVITVEGNIFTPQSSLHKSTSNTGNPEEKQSRISQQFWMAWTISRFKCLWKFGFNIKRKSWEKDKKLKWGSWHLFQSCSWQSWIWHWTLHITIGSHIQAALALLVFYFKCNTHMRKTFWWVPRQGQGPQMCHI